MSHEASMFMIDWLNMHVVGRVFGDQEVRFLIARCVTDAAKKNISKAELEALVGPLEECIRQARHRKS